MIENLASHQGTYDTLNLTDNSITVLGNIPLGEFGIHHIWVDRARLCEDAEDQRGDTWSLDKQEKKPSGRRKNRIERERRNNQELIGKDGYRRDYGRSRISGMRGRG